MTTLLVPCDGSPPALAALRHVIAQARRCAADRIHLLNVQTPLNLHIARRLDRASRMDFLHDRAHAALAPAQRLAVEAGVAHQVHVAVGDKVRCIAGFARDWRCDRIVMGSARRSALVRLVDNSLTNRLLEHSPVPVEVVGCNRAGAVERVGIPIGVGAGLALLWIG